MEDIIYYFLCRGDGLHKKIPPEYSFYLSLLSYLLLVKTNLQFFPKSQGKGLPCMLSLNHLLLSFYVSMLFTQEKESQLEPRETK